MTAFAVDSRSAVRTDVADATGPCRARAALFGGLCLCCLPTLGRAAEAFTIEEVGPGIFMRKGLIADATADNADAIANIGFIVGKHRRAGDGIRRQPRRRPMAARRDRQAHATSRSPTWC